MPQLPKCYSEVYTQLKTTYVLTKDYGVSGFKNYTESQCMSELNLFVNLKTFKGLST